MPRLNLTASTCLACEAVHDSGHIACAACARAAVSNPYKYGARHRLVFMGRDVPPVVSAPSHVLTVRNGVPGCYPVKTLASDAAGAWGGEQDV